MISLEDDIKTSFKYFKGNTVFCKNSNEYSLEGELHCCVKGFEELQDIFNVLITIPFIFPNKLPTVIEKDGNIPRSKEYHINNKGKCCIGTNITLFDYMHRNKISSFCQYLEQIIIIYFFQLKHYIVKGYWLEKPESHFTKGLIDSYIRIFDLTKSELEKKLSLKFKRYDKCLCKSNRRFDKCHGKYIPLEQVKEDFKEMLKFLRVQR